MSHSYNKSIYSPISMRPQYFFSCDVIWRWHRHLNLFELRRRFLFFPPAKRWDHSNRELLLYSSMFYSGMTSCYWKTLLPSSMKVMWGRKPGWAQRRCGCEKQQHFMLKSLKMQFSSLCFWWFSLNFCEPETLSHILYPPTHTQAHTSYELSTWIHTTWTHAQLPLRNSSLCSLKVLKMFSASSPPVCASSPRILPSSHL